MAGSVNKVILIGNLGANPELKYLPSGQAVCEMRIATNESFTDKQGVKQDRTEWHRVVVWGKQAENCSQYLTKGRQAYIEGRLQTRSWDDKEGQKRYTTEIVAQQVQFLGGGGGEAGGRAPGGAGGGSSRHGGGDEPPPDFGGGSPDGNPDNNIPF